MTDVTDVTLGASYHCLGTRTGAGGTVKLTWSIFGAAHDSIDSRHGEEGSASVVSGQRACLEIQGSRVQIRLGSMDFSGRKNPEHKSSGRDFKLGGPESEISGSLKNLKPEKIGLWAKFNRYIYVLVSKFGEHNRYKMVAVHCAAMTTPLIQYNTCHELIKDLFL